MSGPGLLELVPALSRLRIKIFREFPYLYDGELAYEEKYLNHFIRSPGAVIVVAESRGEIVGASTALPLRDEPDTLKKPFREVGIDPDSVFYFGESVLEKSWRGRGIGVRFFEEREAHALEFPWMKLTAFCAVRREPSHPEWPPDYTPLNEFWAKRGYSCQDGLETVFTWKEITEETESEKEMVFWTKSWDRNS